MRYFYVLSANYFHGSLAPALAASWRSRSFGCIPKLRGDLRHRSDVPFRKDLWRQLVGELLLSESLEVPELQTPLELFGQLCGEELAEVRSLFSPIQQACLGANDLCFAGGYYRPEHAGWNDLLDVCRLAQVLGSVNPDEWSTADLAGFTTEERHEELAYAQEWYRGISEMYCRAKIQACVVVSEWV